jgi:hypothetical protein
MSSFVMKIKRCFVDRKTPTGFKAVTLLVMAAEEFLRRVSLQRISLQRIS